MFTKSLQKKTKSVWWSPVRPLYTKGTSPFVPPIPILQSLHVRNTKAPLEKNATDVVWPIQLAQKLLARGHSLFKVWEKYDTLLPDGYFASYGNCILDLFSRSIMSLQLWSEWTCLPTVKMSITQMFQFISTAVRTDYWNFVWIINQSIIIAGHTT